MRSHVEMVDGVPLRYEQAGEGPAVVLLHGIPTSPDLWRYVVPLLADVRIVAFEMLGYGRSILEGRDRDLSVAAQAGYLNGLLDVLGLERVVLAGHDLGGGVAQIVAVQRPERVAGLMLTNSIAYDSWPIPSVRTIRALPAVVARTPMPLLRAGLGTLVGRGHDDLGIARESLAVHTAHYQAADGAAGLAREAAALDVRDTLAVADRLPELEVPSRVVWGLADQFQKAHYGQRLARDLRTRPIGIRGGKHFTPEDHPREIAQAILEVVREAHPARVPHRSGPSHDT